MRAHPGLTINTTGRHSLSQGAPSSSATLGCGIQPLRGKIQYQPVSTVMELWDQRIGSQTERLKRLTAPQLLLFGIGCADHALAMKLPDFSKVISPEHLQVVGTALAELLAYIRGKLDPHSLAHSHNELSSLLPQNEDDDFGPLGWIQILEALIEIIEAIDKEEKFQIIFCVADAAYQAICQNELQLAMLASRKLTLSGDEIPQAEASSPQCQMELAFQLECLQAIEEGKTLNPALPDAVV